MDTIFIFLADYFFLVVAIFAVVLIFFNYSSQLFELGIAAVSISTLAYLLSQLATRLVASPRPFAVPGGKPALIASDINNGFPSGHTLFMAVVASVVTRVSLKWGLRYWIFTLIVGLSRVYVGVHHLIDVAGSIGIGLIALATFLLVRTSIQFLRIRRNRQQFN